jgi:2-polyprenyl-3-methyl-5-hydroxy-6-metoxy-1,4-benzoquinol methylase
MSLIRRVVSKALRHPAIVEPASYLIRRRGPTGIGQATWDREYKTGQWDYLGGRAEMPRYAIIAGYCRFIASTASLLDIGCGNGLLSTWICRDRNHRYVGIDISNAAIRQARERRVNQARFEVADAAIFDPGDQFDVIVFNEMLYYMASPESVLEHYEGFLRSGGVFIISMWRTTTSLQTWRRCASRLKLIDEVRVRSANTNEWDVRLCRPSKILTGTVE